MNQKIIFCSALLTLGLGAITTASAQYYVGPRIYDVSPRVYDPGVPPREVMAIVRSAGLAPQTRPVRRGGTYVLIAASRGGNPVRVVVDAYEGDILRVSPANGVGRDGGPRITYGRDPRFDGGVPPVPPRGVPNAHLANVPPAAAPLEAKPEAKPEHAPLPRRRPSVAAAAPAADPIVPPAASAPAAVPTPPAEAAPATPPAEAAPKPQAPTLVPVAPLD